MPYFLDADDQARFGISEPDDQAESDWQSEFSTPEIEPCPECSEPAVASWDHLPECPYYEEMLDLPF